jgi:hypothetical protein
MPTPRPQTLKGLLLLIGLFALAGLLIFLEQPTGSVQGIVLEAHPFEYKGVGDEAGVTL